MDLGEEEVRTETLDLSEEKSVLNPLHPLTTNEQAGIQRKAFKFFSYDA